MAEKRHPIDELFRSKLGNYEMESPDNLWNNIAQKRSSGSVSWFKGNMLIMSSMMLLALCGGMYWWNSPANGQGTTASGTATYEQAAGATGNNQEGIAATSGTATTNMVTPVSYSNNSTPSPVHYNIAGSTDERAPMAKEELVERMAKEIAAQNQNPFASAGNQALQTLEEMANRPDFSEIELANYVSAINKKLTEITGHQFTNGTNITKPATVSKTSVAKSGMEETEGGETTLQLNMALAAKGTTATKIAHEKHASPWSVDLYSRMVWGMPNISGSSDYAAHIKARKDADKYTMSPGLGFRLNYKLNNYVTLGAGLSYTRINEKMDFRYERTDMKITPVTNTYEIRDGNGNLIGTKTITTNDTSYVKTNNSVKNTNRITLVDLPFIAEFKFIDKQVCSYAGTRFGLSFQPGVVANIYMKKTGYEINKNADKAEMLNAANNPYRLSSGISLRLGLSAQLDLCKNVSLVVQPAYTYGLSSAASASYPVNYKLNSFSTDIGLRFRLSR